MRPTQHFSNNGVLGAPDGWDQKNLPCGAVPITRTTVAGLPAILTYWTPTLEERALIAAGAKVELWIQGQSMPPVMLSVEPELHDPITIVSSGD